MRRTNWWKNIFWKTLPQFVWDFERNAFGNENSQSCQNWNLRVRKNTSMKKHFFEKNFIHFFTLFENFSDFLQFFSKLTKLFFKWSDRHFGEEIFFWKTLPKGSFRFWAKHFSTFDTIFTKRLSKPFSTWSGNISRKQTISFFVFNTFSDFGQKFSQVSHKFFRKVVKTAFYVFRRTVWWKKRKLLKIVFFS